MVDGVFIDSSIMPLYSEIGLVDLSETGVGSPPGVEGDQFVGVNSTYAAASRVGDVCIKGTPPSSVYAEIGSTCSAINTTAANTTTTTCYADVGDKSVRRASSSLYAEIQDGGRCRGDQVDGEHSSLIRGNLARNSTSSTSGYSRIHISNCVGSRGGGGGGGVPRDKDMRDSPSMNTSGYAPPTRDNAKRASKLNNTFARGNGDVVDGGVGDGKESLVHREHSITDSGYARIHQPNRVKNNNNNKTFQGSSAVKRRSTSGGSTNGGYAEITSRMSGDSSLYAEIDASTSTLTNHHQHRRGDSLLRHSTPISPSTRDPQHHCEDEGEGHDLLEEEQLYAQVDSTPLHDTSSSSASHSQVRRPPSLSSDVYAEIDCRPVLMQTVGSRDTSPTVDPRHPSVPTVNGSIPVPPQPAPPSEGPRYSVISARESLASMRQRGAIQTLHSADQHQHQQHQQQQQQSLYHEITEG